MNSNMGAQVSFARVASALLLCASLVTLGGCATGALPTEMVATPTPITTVSPGENGYQQLRVASVQGGSETNPLWMSNISNADFQAALESSLRGVGYLSTDPALAHLQVTASITDLQRPMAGIDMSVTSKVRYTVSPVGGGAPVFDGTVAATGTARFGESLLAIERLRKANEASIRANIASFLEQLRTALKKPAP
jgi:hypothetical protein